MRTKKISTLEKQCECCGSNNLERLWSYSQNSKQRSNIFTFDVNHAICKECGFVFLSPTYLQSDLNLYYQDSFTYYTPDFNLQYRIDFIKKHLVAKGDFLEVGGNDRNAFHDKLSELFNSVTVQDVNQSGDTDQKSDVFLKNPNYDCIAHYFVLEHVPNVGSFLQNCYDLLKSDGHMIVEVPDLKKYKKFFEPLRFHEHTNHFTIEILERICSKFGFQLIAYDDTNCSRAFGFSVLFKKVSDSTTISNQVFSKNYELNLKYFKEGKQEFENNEKFLLSIYSQVNKMTEAGKNILFWGANSVLRKIIENKPRLRNTIFIDSDKRKEHFLDDLGLKVLNPYTDKINFKQYDKFVLCASINYLDQILAFLKEEGIEFDNQNIWVASGNGRKIN